TKETNGTTRKIISSYTVDPKALLLTPTSSTYDYFIDENGVEAVEQKQKDADVSKSQFLINISHSDQESSLDSDSDGFDDLDCEAAFVGV
ncbi:hypothetical protein PP707_05445, partial [Acetobacter pasteurianus]|nr:hypothetical protein [Acetobacter pasteurianus]